MPGSKRSPRRRKTRTYDYDINQLTDKEAAQLREVLTNLVQMVIEASEQTPEGKRKKWLYDNVGPCLLRSEVQIYQN